MGLHRSNVKEEQYYNWVWDVTQSQQHNDNWHVMIKHSGTNLCFPMAGGCPFSSSPVTTAPNCAGLGYTSSESRGQADTDTNHPVSHDIPVTPWDDLIFFLGPIYISFSALTAPRSLPTTPQGLASSLRRLPQMLFGNNCQDSWLWSASKMSYLPLGKCIGKEGPFSSMATLQVPHVWGERWWDVVVKATPSSNWKSRDSEGEGGGGLSLSVLFHPLPCPACLQPEFTHTYSLPLWFLFTL